MLDVSFNELELLVTRFICVKGLVNMYKIIDNIMLFYITITVSLSMPSSSSRVRVARLSSGSVSADALSDCNDNLLN